MSVLDERHIEIEDVLNKYDQKRCDQEMSDDQLLVLAREENAVLFDLLTRQKRLMTAMAGEKVEPVTHYAEAVLLPAGGGGT